MLKNEKSWFADLVLVEGGGLGWETTWLVRFGRPAGALGGPRLARASGGR